MGFFSACLALGTKLDLQRLLLHAGYVWSVSTGYVEPMALGIGTPKFPPRAAGWKAQTLALCNAVPKKLWDLKTPVYKIIITPTFSTPLLMFSEMSTKLELFSGSRSAKNSAKMRPFISIKQFRSTGMKWLVLETGSTVQMQPRKIFLSHTFSPRHSHARSLSLSDFLFHRFLSLSQSTLSLYLALYVSLHLSLFISNKFYFYFTHCPSHFLFSFSFFLVPAAKCNMHNDKS